MVFDNDAQLKKYILSKCERSIIKAQEKIYKIIDQFLRQYYNEYDPVMYDRTYQVFNSFVMTDIFRVGDGFDAYIYFDMNSMNHTLGSGMTEEKIMDYVMSSGTHGGFKAPKNTKVWVESMKILAKNGNKILKDMLISEGIPIK
jgi:hypothetical protein